MDYRNTPEADTHVHPGFEQAHLGHPPKRRKLEHPTPSKGHPGMVNVHGTVVNPVLGTVSPSVDMAMQSMTSAPPNGNMMEDIQPTVECPCGHLHGPGQGNHHDVHAVGLGVPLLRGPD